jgi:hypothetical protein
VNEIALEVEATPEAALSEEQRTMEAVEPAARTAVPPRAGRSHEGAAVRSREPTAETASPPSAPSPNEGTWTFSPTTGSGPSSGSVGGRSLDAAVRAGVSATLAQERADDPARRRVLVPPIGPRDIELGLAPGGSLATLARDLVRQSRAPDVSHAVLQFDTDAAGIVTSARVLDASSGFPEWEEVAAQIATAARARPPLRVPHGWQGLSVTIDVTSEVRTASGAKTTGNLLDKALGAINDPIGTATRTPPQRVVATRMVDVTVF